MYIMRCDKCMKPILLNEAKIYKHTFKSNVSGNHSIEYHLCESCHTEFVKLVTENRKTVRSELHKEEGGDDHDQTNIKPLEVLD